MIGSLASWVLSGASEHSSPLPAWQRCKRCGLKVDLPDDAAKAADAVYCGPECWPAAPFQGVDVSRLLPRVRR